MDLNLDKKVVFVTGSSRGIGLSISEGFLKEGAKVILNSRNQDELETVKQKLIEKYDRENIFVYVGDLTQEEQINQSIEYIKNNIGVLDILVANIGSGKSEGKVDSEDEIKRMNNLNCKSSELIASESIKIFNKHGSSIIFISSIAGLEDIGAPKGYQNAKKNLIELTKTLSNKYAPKGIRVNTVAPGNIKFPGGRWEEILEERPDDIEKILDKVPMHRFGKPVEIANIVVFLASDKASFVTGSCWVADGGQLKRIIHDRK